MKKFRSIEGLSKIFHHMRSNATYHNIPHSSLPTLNFTGTVKIHGTNAGIRIPSAQSETCFAQGRDRELSIASDNAGFASFCYALPSDIIQSLYKAVNPKGKGELTIFGEWAGQGVQNGVGVSEVSKHFVMFSAHVVDEAGEGHYIPLNPTINFHEWRIYNIYEVATYAVDIDFANPGDIEDILTELTLAVEASCPWAQHMGVEGIGEGIVWHLTSDPTDSSFVFKTKGPKHSVRKNKNQKVASVDVEKVNTVNECVDIILTENRMLQMVKDNGFSYIKDNVGPFLKAVCEDCIKEEMAVVVKSNLVWRDVAGEVNRRAKAWFLEKEAAFIKNN